jgi:hypothetical protein
MKGQSFHNLGEPNYWNRDLEAQAAEVAEMEIAAQ